MTMLRTFWEAAEALDPEGAARFSEGTIMRYAKPDDLEQLWVEAGLDQVRVVPLVAEAAYDDRRPVGAVSHRRRPGWQVHGLRAPASDVNCSRREARKVTDRL
jgi:hypothetical protein